MAKFKLMKRYKLRNAAEGPTEGAEDDLWYAIPALGNRLDTREVCKAATRYSTVAPAEAEMVLNLLRDGVVHELQLGNSVQLGEFGWMRLSFSSEGVKDVTVRLYPEGRHEMLNEINRDEVYRDVLRWLELRF